jgi:acetyltransferase-like isoleucine patch superfamily enzyme
MGDNVAIGFGTIFFYRDVAIGSNVLIGNYNVIHHCDFGSFVLTADHCQFLSGSKYHCMDRIDIPMALQGGRLRRILVADDCWIGANCVIMNHLGAGCVAGAGSIVTREVSPYSVVAGNPARILRSRLDSHSAQLPETGPAVQEAFDRRLVGSST